MYRASIFLALSAIDRRSAGMALVVATVLAASSRADDGPYCGIYAIYGAVNALGRPSDIQPLIDATYISGRAGSTVADLVRAAESLGVGAKGLVGLGPASLTASQDPLVLHVASLGQLEAFNHWLLFLGMEDGKARIVDGSGKVHRISLGELMARWDGVAVAVYVADSPLTNFGAAETASVGWWAILATCLIGPLALAIHRVEFLRTRPALTWSVSLVVLSLSVFLGREAIGDVSFSRHPDSVRFIIAAEEGKALPIVSTAEMVALTKDPGDTLIVDARYERDYRHGHIPGAISLPVDANQQFIDSALRGISRRRPVVLYCQSAGCGFDERMAVVLTSFGFQNMREYHEGWVGWKKFLNDQSKEQK